MRWARALNALSAHTQRLERTHSTRWAHTLHALSTFLYLIQLTTLILLYISHFHYLARASTVVFTSGGWIVGWSDVVVI